MTLARASQDGPTNMRRRNGELTDGYWVALHNSLNDLAEEEGAPRARAVHDDTAQPRQSLAREVTAQRRSSRDAATPRRAGRTTSLAVRALQRSGLSYAYEQVMGIRSAPPLPTVQ
jgi:hypothetical protein